MKEKKPLTPISSVLPGVLKQLRAEGRPSSEAIRGVWKRLVGEKGARHSWPKKLKKGRLLVEVDSSGWMYTLNTRKRELLQGLVELVGAGLIKQLSFRVGEAEDA